MFRASSRAWRPTSGAEAELDRSLCDPVFIDAYRIGGARAGSDVMTSTRRLLVIEDDPDIAEMLRVNLRDEGFTVEHAADGTTGLARIETESFDLVVLDLMLPGIDGLEICRRIRTQQDYTPLVITSARSAESHRIVGLELGADDYLTKPYSVFELAARIRALFRRVDRLREQAASPTVEIIHIGDLRLDVAAREVSTNGRPIVLTPREFDLLFFFARHPNRVFTRLELLNQVWGYGHDGYEHTVNSHINRLRAKIEADPSSPTCIVTVWGVGYKLIDTVRLSGALK
jgi:DNA-binding response OmpR family regulator